ncbi:hypothetical protein LMIY3S_02327 [Labrys miyagiensis]
MTFSCNEEAASTGGDSRNLWRAITLVLGGIGMTIATASPSWGQSSNSTAVHPERGGLLLETEEQRYLLQKGAVSSGANLDPRLSIFVTDRKTMSQITFKEVMQQLVNQSGDPNLTAKQLFDSWWDSADLHVPLGKTPVTDAVHHCNDESEPEPKTRLSTLNGFPYRCPRPERILATEDPFDATKPEGYIPIAYSNRFDLADPAGRDCGEYRIVFARVSGADPNDRRAAANRNLIIFEARVKNPAPPVNLASNPQQVQSNPNSMENLRGCKPIIDAWSKLSNPAMNTTDRGKALHDLYIKGIPSSNVAPFISVDNYRGNGQGQIRTNQFVNHGGEGDPTASREFIWTLREFKIGRVPTPTGSSSIQIVPQTVKANPGTSLFDALVTTTRTNDFIDQVIGQLGPLRGGLGGEGNIDTFSYNNPDRFNSFESDESSDANISAGGKLGSVLMQFDAERGVLFGRLQQALLDQGSKLTPSQVVARLQTQTCAGCHRFSNRDLNGAAANPGNDLGGGLNWTQSLGFTQESERDFEGGPDGNASRFLISDLLKDVFLPARLDNMRRFMAQQ